METTSQEEKIERKVSSKNIYQRMIDVMSSSDYLQKHDANAGLRYKFVSHDRVVGELHAPMTLAGIVFVPTVESFGHNGTYMEMKLRCDFVNADNPTDRITVFHQVPSRTPCDEKTYGTTLSYAIKYVLLKTFMLETGDDADIDEKDKEANKDKAKAELESRYAKKDIPKQVYNQPAKPTIPPLVQPKTEKLSPSIQQDGQDLFLSKEIVKLIPGNIPNSFARDYVVLLMNKKNCTWDEIQRSILLEKNTADFVTKLKEHHESSKLALNIIDKQTKAV